MGGGGWANGNDTELSVFENILFSKVTLSIRMVSPQRSGSSGGGGGGVTNLDKYRIKSQLLDREIEYLNKFNARLHVYKQDGAIKEEYS